MAISLRSFSLEARPEGGRRKRSTSGLMRTAIVRLIPMRAKLLASEFLTRTSCSVFMTLPRSISAWRRSPWLRSVVV